MQLTKALAQAVEAENRIVAVEEAAEVVEDYHTKLISEAYLTSHASGRILHLLCMEGHLVLEGVPLYPMGSIKRKFLDPVPTPPPPTPREAANEEELLP